MAWSTSALPAPTEPTRSGDVANKIGTYLKALAAADNNVPFYVALPSTTIDWEISDGVRDIPIEERDTREVSHIWGRSGSELLEVVTVGERTPISNYAFDVTPSRLITGLITSTVSVPRVNRAWPVCFPNTRSARDDRRRLHQV